METGVPYESLFFYSWKGVHMTTKRQIAANRRNARKSTGPRSVEGKERSSRNAVKHGLTSRRAVLADEDPAQFLEYRIEVHADLRPMGALETTLANRITAQMWRLARIPAIEAEMIDTLRRKPGEGGDEIGGLAAAWEEDEATYGGSLARLSRYETALERSLMRLQAEFRRVQDRRNKLEAAEMPPLVEHESDRYVPGGMENLGREPDGSYRRTGPPGGAGAGGGAGMETRARKESDLRNKADTGG